MWWGVALALLCVSPSSLPLAAGALANTVLFFAVSIPMADGRQGRKAGFAEYKRETRALLPVPPLGVGRTGRIVLRSLAALALLALVALFLLLTMNEG